MMMKKVNGIGLSVNMDTIKTNVRSAKGNGEERLDDPKKCVHGVPLDKYCKKCKR